eukprot:12923145-Alexandrium_andersonii.AAC.1
MILQGRRAAMWQRTRAARSAYVGVSTERPCSTPAFRALVSQSYVLVGGSSSLLAHSKNEKRPAWRHY